jgi:NitT/TauT family transport system substrate-binding protein
VLALVAAAAGCSTAGSPGGKVSSAITIALVPGINDAPVYLAERDGLFAKAGLSNVTIKSYSTDTQVLKALQAGDADIAALDYGDIFYQEAHHPDLSILADGYDAGSGVLEVLTLKTSHINSPAQLGDKPVGLPNYDLLNQLKPSGHPISLEAAAVSEVLNSYIGNAALSVNWRPMSEADEVKELLSGTLSAIVVGEPYIYEAESQHGAVELMDASSGPTAGLPLSGYVSMSPWAKDNQAAVADFQAALAKAQSDAGMFGPVQQLLPRVVSDVSAEDADLSTLGTFPTTTSLVGLNRVPLLMSNEDMIAVGPGQTWNGKVGSILVHN